MESCKAFHETTSATGMFTDGVLQKCSACTKSRPKAHGAPIQCTKGKCPKAFHVSCARDGNDQHIIFEVLREVEKEVVLLDPASSDQMQVDSVTGLPMDDSQVLKVIKKVEVQVLCTQHNPVSTVLFTLRPHFSLFVTVRGRS